MVEFPASTSVWPSSDSHRIARVREAVADPMPDLRRVAPALVAL